jgi:hypothetical protein
MWNLQKICRAFASPWQIEEVNLGPFSDWIEVGRPKHRMISVPRIEATVEALLLVVGKALTHPKKVFTSTRRYLVLFIGSYG